MKKLQEYVEDLNANIEKLDTRGPVSKYVLPDENLRGRSVFACFTNWMPHLTLAGSPIKSERDKLVFHFLVLKFHNGRCLDLNSVSQYLKLGLFFLVLVFQLSIITFSFNCQVGYYL